MLLDVHGAISTMLRGEALPFDVFCDEVPDGHDGPVVLVRGPSLTPTVPGVLAWDDCEIQVDVLGTPQDHAAAREVAGKVRALIHGQRGRTLSDVVFQDLETRNVVHLDDPTYSPARPRWVLTVAATVRSAENGAI